MNTHAGYSKRTITDTNVLLAGGGDKSLADFIGGIQYVSASNKIQYRAADTNTWTDLVTLVTTDENVKQTPKTDNANRPLMMINGGTATGTLTSTSMFSIGIYANASTNMLTTSGFIRTGSDNTHVLLGGGGHALAGHSNNDSPYIPIADGTVCSTLNADMLDGYHANTIYQVATHTINNGHTSNTWKRIATITISGTGLSTAGFTAIFSNRECLDNTSFILTLGIRRNNTTSAAEISFYYTALQGSVPRTITVRSDDNQTFYVYFQSVANTYTTYYNVTKIMTEGNVTYENVGLTSIIDGTLTNKNALKGGNVNLADTATALKNTHKLWGQDFNGTLDVSGNMTGVGTISASGNNTITKTSGDATFAAVNNNGRIELHTSANRGVYDRTLSRWLIATNGTNSWLACGNVGIGITSPLYKLDVDGNVRATNFYTTSDRNKKENISEFSEHIRKFQLKNTEKLYYGVIAQEVEEIFRDGEEGNMTVNYNSVLSYYIGQLENRVKELEERIRILESK